jgi:hypothetical protein
MVWIMAREREEEFIKGKETCVSCWVFMVGF